jgi:hypothetical protein
MFSPQNEPAGGLSAAAALMAIYSPAGEVFL